MAAINGFNGISEGLPLVSVNNVNVAFAGHHAVSQSVFGDSDFFDALKDLKLFDGRNWSSNGVPLPRTSEGAIATGMALHNDGHPAYIAWQRVLFRDFESDFRSQNFGGLSREQWLAARANDINGFKAYVQTELMKPDSPLVLTWRQLPNAEVYENLPDAQKAAIRAQFDAIKWDGPGGIRSSTAFQIATTVKNGAQLFDATPGSGSAFDIKRGLSGTALDDAIDGELGRLKQLTDLIRSNPSARTLAESIAAKDLRRFDAAKLSGAALEYSQGKLAIRDFQVAAKASTPIGWLKNPGGISNIVLGLTGVSLSIFIAADKAKAGEAGSWQKSAEKFGVPFSQEQLLAFGGSVAAEIATEFAISSAAGPLGAAGVAGKRMWEAYQSGDAVVSLVDMWATALPESAALQILNEVLQDLQGLSYGEAGFMFGPPAAPGAAQPIFAVDPTTGLPRRTTYNRDDVRAVTNLIAGGEVSAETARAIAPNELVKIGELARKRGLDSRIVGDFARAVAQGDLSALNPAHVAMANKVADIVSGATRIGVRANESLLPSSMRLDADGVSFDAKDTRTNLTTTITYTINPVSGVIEEINRMTSLPVGTSIFGGTSPNPFSPSIATSVLTAIPQLAGTSSQAYSALNVPTNSAVGPTPKLTVGAQDSNGNRFSASYDSGANSGDREVITKPREVDGVHLQTYFYWADTGELFGFMDYSQYSQNSTWSGGNNQSTNDGDMNRPATDNAWSWIQVEDGYNWFEVDENHKVKRNIFEQGDGDGGEPIDLFGEHQGDALYLGVDSNGQREIRVRTKTDPGRVHLPEAKIISYEQIGAVFGSQLGNVIGGDSAFARIATGTALSVVLGNVGQTLDYYFNSVRVFNNGAVSPANLSIEESAYRAFGNFASDLVVQVRQAGIGAVSSFLAAELTQDIRGFGGQLGNVAANSLINRAITNVANRQSVFSGFTGDLFALPDGNFAGGIGFTTGAAVSSFIGGYLAHKIVAPENLAGSLAGSIGGTLGSMAFGSVAFVGSVAAGIGLAGSAIATTVLGIILPGIGALIGTLLGTVLGNFLGGLFEDEGYGTYSTALAQGGNKFVDAGGGTDDWDFGGPVHKMRAAAMKALNDLTKMVGGTVVGDNRITLTFTNHDGRFTASVTETNSRSTGATPATYSTSWAGKNPNAFVHNAVIAALKRTTIVGGDTYMKQAIAQSTATTVEALALQMAVAQSFGNIIEAFEGIVGGDIKGFAMPDFNRSIANETAAEALSKSLALTALKAATVTGGDRYAVAALEASTATTLEVLERQIQVAVYYGKTLRAVAESFGGTIASDTLPNFNQSFATDAAISAFIDREVLAQLKTARIDGGNIYVKRAIDNSRATTLDALSGDIALALDFGRYIANKEVIDTIIALSPQSVFAAGWVITLLKAVELKIDVAAASDFHGGVAGFVKGIGLENYGATLDDVSFTVSGANLVMTIADPNGGTGRQVTLENYQSRAELRPASFAATVTGTTGNDLWFAPAAGGRFTDSSTLSDVFSNDVLIGGAGADIMTAGNGQDYLSGGGGNDTLKAGSGADVLLGGAGADVLEGEGGDDVYVFSFGDGRDSIFDHLMGTKIVSTTTTRQDLISTNYTEEVFHEAPLVWSGKGTSRTARISTGKNTSKPLPAGARPGNQGKEEGYFTTETRTRVRAKTVEVVTNTTVAEQKDAGLDQLHFGSGISIADLFIGRSSDDMIIKLKKRDAAGNLVPEASLTDVLTINAWANVLNRVEDFVFADGLVLNLEDIDYAYTRGDAADTLAGTSTGDLFVAGRGNDVLRGGLGADTYVFSRGDGSDTIEDIDTSADPSKSRDTLQLGAGIGASDLLARFEGNDLVIAVRDPDLPNQSFAQVADKIRLVGWRTEDNRIEQLRFADGTVLTAAQMVGLVATSGNDVISFATGAAAIDGRAGDDTIRTGGYADTLAGGAGNDRLEGSRGNDTYIFGRGYEKDAVYDHFMGTKVIEVPETYQVTVNQTYTVNVTTGVGKSARTVQETRTRQVVETRTRMVDKTVADQKDAGDDTLSFGSGLTVEDLFLRKSGADLVIGLRERNAQGVELAFGSLKDVLTIEDWSNKLNRIERFAFADGTVLDMSDVERIVSLSDADDTIVGTSLGDYLHGGGGNDRFDGSLGNDVIVGGDGRDTVDYGSVTTGVSVSLASNRVTKSGGLSDRIYGVENVVGTAENDTLYGDAEANALYGGSGNDTLLGGVGNDVLNGGAGSDTYIFGRGYDTDRIRNNDASAATADKVLFGSGITGSNLLFSRTGSDLTVGILGTSDKLIFENWYTDAAQRVDFFETSDGKSVGIAGVNALVSAMASFAPTSAAVSNATTVSNLGQSVQLAVSQNWRA